MAIKLGGKILIGAIIFGGILYGANTFLHRSKSVAQSTEVGQVTIPDAPEASLKGEAANKLALPSADAEITPNGPTVTVLEMAWAAQSSLNYANGGVHTTKGSLLNKAGFNIWAKIQNDDGKSQQDMVAWVKDYAKGNTKEGMFVIDMGSQLDSYLKTMNDLLKPLGPDYQIVIFDAVGFSQGEDQIIGASDFKTNPQSLRGKVCHGVRLGGDLDIIIKFCGDNGIPVNPNEKIYDPNALNLSYSNDFLKAVEEFNSNLTEKRQLVRNGKTAGDTIVGFDMVATWTPGDVNAFNGGRNDLATIISTKQYRSMMPAMVMTCKKYLKVNANKIPDFIRAVAQGSDQVNSYKDVQDYTMGLNADIWPDPGAKKPFWIRYFRGVNNGNQHMGGSKVSNLKDVSNLFGIQGGTDVYKEVYNTFLDAHKKLYKKEYDGAPEYYDAVVKTYMAAAIANPGYTSGEAEKIDYSLSTNKVAHKDVHINFNTGSSTISPSSYSLLDDIYSNAVAAQGLKVGVYGYTDNTGNPESNLTLSAERAEAVKQYLLQKGLDANQIESKGYGDADPVATNATASGKAQNRRVQIALLGN